MVGSYVGVSLGDVGSIDGTPVGRFVGVLVGGRVYLVGKAVVVGGMGSFVGVFVGTMVGLPVGS